MIQHDSLRAETSIQEQPTLDKLTLDTVILILFFLQPDAIIALRRVRVLSQCFSFALTQYFDRLARPFQALVANA